MEIIKVNASKEYEVVIGRGILPTLGERCLSLFGKSRAVIVTDSNVAPLWLDKAKSALEGAGIDTVEFIFPAGEDSKSKETLFELLEFAAENRITRSDFAVALGGGVTGDMTGLAASLYLRGIPFVQVPTTLLAAVDSSVGGKTAVNLAAGKNLAGAFYQPKLVLCDPGVLNTLPEEIFRDGCAEIIKYGILYDPQLFDHLMEKGLGFDRKAVISRCIELKRDVVKEDEFDTGARQKLNLGHTIGHGIEKQSNYTVSHGQAVAIGMAIIAKAAASKGLCSMSLLDDVCRILDLFQLPRSTELSATELYESALSDKKRAGGTVNLIVPRHIGDCLICPTPVAEMKSFIEAGM